MTDPQKVIVVGAGPVGALAAYYAAARGDNVEIYELRGDLRDPSTTPLNFTKSINLALSERGINAMRHAGSKDLVESVMKETIYMKGRMIHGKNQRGQLYEESQPYDVHGRKIYAADRAGLNAKLLDALDNMSNVRFFFNHKLTGADFKKNKAWFERRLPDTKILESPQHEALPNNDADKNRAPEIEVDFDFLIGADGAHSAARYHMMKFARVTYEQEYIDTLWCEFHIAGWNGVWAMDFHHLHIWPGQEYMFIAIPSNDRTFTCTLFAPHSTFDYLSENVEQNVPRFFQEKFPGVAPLLISKKKLIQQFTENPHLPLISIKCTPYQYESSVVILGDAAHAMVPFYGQGMNAGLEDVRVLFEQLERHGVYSAPDPTARKSARAKALAEYTVQRTPDARAINDLALRNYFEMRSAVTSPIYRLRKFVEERLSKYFPSSGWSTQYSRISFGNERYSEVEKAVSRQSSILLAVIEGLLGLGVMSLAGLLGYRALLRRGGYVVLDLRRFLPSR